MIHLTLCVPCRAAASSKGKQVGGAASSSKKGGRPAAAAAAAARPSAEDVARKREQLAAAAEARLKALQQKQQLWSVAALYLHLYVHILVCYEWHVTLQHCCHTGLLSCAELHCAQAGRLAWYSDGVHHISIFCCL
jgi:hypothetical protein